jgi:hypothetical protein
MANFPVPVGDPVALPFSAFEEDGVTPLAGLVDGDWTKKLVRGLAAMPNTVTVTESAEAGTYVVEFTPDADGTWYVEVSAPGHAEEAIWGGYVQAGFTAVTTCPEVVARTVECP